MPDYLRAAFSILGTAALGVLVVVILWIREDIRRTRQNFYDHRFNRRNDY